MSQRWGGFVDDPARQCAGKRGYRSKGDAKRVAKRVGMTGVAAYRCPHCGFFHLGTKP